MTKLQSAFPLVQEMLRDMMQILDLRLSEKEKKSLDDKIQDASIPLHLVNKYNKHINESLKKILSPDLYGVTKEFIGKHLLQDYRLRIAGKIVADGCSREEIEWMLANLYYPVKLMHFFKHILPEKYHLVNLQSLLSNEEKIGMVGKILDVFEEEELSGWSKYKKSLETKEEQDKLGRWRRGEYIPSYTELCLLKKYDSDGRMCFWLWLAAGADRLCKSNPKLAQDFFCSARKLVAAQDIPMDCSNDIRDIIRTHQQKKFGYLAAVLMPVFAELHFELLNNSKEKSEIDRQKAKDLIQYARDVLQRQGVDSQNYRWDWLEAKWFLLSGELEQAVEMYQQVFQAAMYRAGKEVNTIIQEALMTTAFLERQYKKANRKFLAHLKNASVFFGYELPAVDGEPQKINHHDIVAEWEVDLWARAFGQYFPKQGWFPSTGYELFSPVTNLISNEEMEKFRPDFRSINRMVKIGDKKMPQLIFFSYFKPNYEYFKQLLRKGADVNLLSHSNESALLFALENLNLMDILKRNQNKDFFDLITSYPHKVETVNAKTVKRKKFPLMLAVESGRADVVKKVLDMGAEVDMINFDGIAPLYRAIMILSHMQQPERVKAVHDVSSEMITPKNLEELRRNQMVSVPFYKDLAGQAAHAVKIMKKMGLQDVPLNIIHENLRQYSSCQEIYRIIAVLLDSGANPNFTADTSIVKGYTPFMYSIELNDPNVFHMLRNAGGDLSHEAQLYGKPYTCRDVKEHWNSTAIDW